MCYYVSGVLHAANRKIVAYVVAAAGYLFSYLGAGRSSEVEFAHGAMGRRIDPS